MASTTIDGLSQEKIRGMHCGLFKTPFRMARQMMPSLNIAFDQFENDVDRQYGIDRYCIDVKVHMLMPGQYPCIPGWHC